MIAIKYCPESQSPGYISSHPRSSGFNPKTQTRESCVNDSTSSHKFGGGVAQTTSSSSFPEWPGKGHRHAVIFHRARSGK